MFWQPDPDESIAVIPCWYGSQMEVKVGQHRATTHLLSRERGHLASTQAKRGVESPSVKEMGFQRLSDLIGGLQTGQHKIRH